MDRNETDMRWTAARPLRVFSALIVLLALLSACGAEQQNALEPTAIPGAVATPVPAITADADATAGADVGATAAADLEADVTLSDIADNPDAFYGRDVTIRGDVTDLVGPQSFTLNDSALLGGDSVLVIGVEDGVIGAEGDTVQVTGMVRPFNLTEIEQEAGLDLQDDLFTDYTDRPVIVAESVTTIAGDLVEAISLSDIADDPAAFIGQTVTVRGDATERIGPQSFTLNDQALLGGDSLVVVGADANAPIDDGLFDLNTGESVQVTGVVRLFNLTEIEQEVGYDLQDDLFTDYSDRAAIVATSVNVIGDEAEPGAIEGTLTDVADNPQDYVGQTVTVNGNVTEVVGTQSFVLNEEELLEGDEVLVVNAAQATTPFQAAVDEVVQVTGIVRLFNLVDIEEEVGFDLQDDLYADWDNRPVIVAQAIQPADANALEPATGAGVGNVTVADVVGDPAAYLGQTVTVNGDVDRIINPTTFTLDEEALLAAGIDNDLLVIGAATNAYALDDGWLDDQVQVTGTVRNFVEAEIERDFGLDLDNELTVEYENRPVLVATAVTPVE